MADTGSLNLPDREVVRVRVPFRAQGLSCDTAHAIGGVLRKPTCHVLWRNRELEPSECPSLRSAVDGVDRAAADSVCSMKVDLASV
jgi:hypothetical protein